VRKNDAGGGAPLREGVGVGAEDGDLAERLLPHLNAAHNLARWLVRGGHDAEDVVQEAYLRALQYAGGFRGGDARAWLLTIVRNTAYKWLRKTRAYDPVEQFDEEIHTGGTDASNPERLLLQNTDGRLVDNALSQLSVRFREILVLRELEGLSYKEIADVMGVPIGTVMSTLSRARDRFRRAVADLVGFAPAVSHSGIRERGDELGDVWSASAIPAACGQGACERQSTG
jgi:RNA polymerase sigma-70 factor, ECF subfamily